MAEHARQLIKANKLLDVIEVIEGSMEDVTLPEKGQLIYHISFVSCFNINDSGLRFYLSNLLN